jgi:hypothetical protein
MNQDREPHKGHSLQGVGDPAEGRTVTEAPARVDEDLVERMRRLREEIAEDERAVQEQAQQQQAAGRPTTAARLAPQATRPGEGLSCASRSSTASSETTPAAPSVWRRSCSRSTARG